MKTNRRNAMEDLLKAGLDDQAMQNLFGLSERRCCGSANGITDSAIMCTFPQAG